MLEYFRLDNFAYAVNIKILSACLCLLNLTDRHNGCNYPAAVVSTWICLGKPYATAALTS